MPIDPLKIAIEVDVAQLRTLATASQQTASEIDTLAKKFIQSGLSAKESESALVNLGYSSKQAAQVMTQLGTATATLGAETAVATTKIDSMTRALAMGATRMGANEIGAGQLGIALGRIGSISAGLAPILAGSFAAFAAVAFVEILNHAIEAYEKWTHLGEETVHKIDDQTLSLAHESDALDVVNIRLQNQIDKLAGKPENYLALAMAEIQLQADSLAKSLEDVLQKEVAILKAGPGFASELVLGKGNVANVGRLLEPLERQLQLAILAGDKEAQKNVLLEKQAILRKALSEEQAAEPLTADPSMGGIQIGRGPDQDALNAYNSLLRATEEELTRIAKTGKEGELEIQLARARTAKDAEAAAKKYEDLLSKIYLDGVRFAQEGAKADLEAITKRETLEREAQHKLESIERENAAESKRDAAAAEAAWREAAEARIRGEQEALTTSQRAAEERIRDARAEESARSAGLGPGPIKSIFEAESLKEQAAIAAEAMEEAKSAAVSYGAQLDIVRDAMQEVNRDSAEGSRQFKDLESQMMQLQHLMDSATSAANRWGTSLKQISAQQRELGFSIHNIGLASENAAQAGLQSFNSAFIRMAAGGESFVHVMQSLWSGMASSFISSILKMFEEWLTKHVIMAALDKVFGAGEVVTSKAKIAALAGEAGAAGTASWAAAPWPIDAGAAAFGAAMAATAASFALFEKGGIVKAGLHEGEAVLPTNLTTFLMTAAGADGAPGGAGGPGGRGGTSEVSKTQINHNNVHVELHGASTTPADIATAIRRELRKQSISW